MEQNKLKLEDFCLTVEQAKELKELGIDMDNSLFEYIQLVSDKKYIEEAIEKRVLGEPFLYNNNLSTLVIGGNKMYELVTPTLTNTEMLEMLPRYINFNKKLRIYKSKDGIKNMWIVSYEKDGQGVYVKTAELLRDALFEMIKFLKKLII